MNSYLSSNKTEADGLFSIDIRWLKTQGFLNGYKYGIITWTRGENNKNRIELMSNAIDPHPYVRFRYVQRDKETNEKEDFDYKMPLVKTVCNFGGYRYWFICPMSKDGAGCGRRVGVLYKGGDFFACRHCYNLTYKSRNLSNSGYHYYFSKFFDTDEQIDKLEQTIKKRFYRGKPTRKQVKLEKLQDKAYIATAAIISKEGYN